MIESFLSQKVCEVIIVLLLAALALVGIQYFIVKTELKHAQAEVSTLQADKAKLQMAIDDQNAKVAAMGKATQDAQQRGADALVLAESNGKRLGAILSAVKDIKAVTCKAAMPTVDRILEGVLQ
jgi:hypothetical protein